MSESILGKFLKENEGNHYNNVVPTYYKISTGSMKWDLATGGGFGPGVIRFAGSSEGGKTSAALTVAKNFLDTVPNAKVLYIKAEGRLGKKMQKRSGINFVESADKWEAGTAFILKSNIYDSIAQLIFSLVTANDGFKYFIILDSVDSLILKADQEKRFDEGEHTKVCGPNVLTKRLLKTVSLPITEHGHILVLVAQVIAHIENKYEKKEQMDAGGAGGNAQIHFSDNIYQFLPRFKKHLITSDGKVAELDFDETNVVGHWCRLSIKKSDNEKSNLEIQYPIRYGSSGETGAVWSEMEIKDVMEKLGLVISKGAWCRFSPMAMEIMKNGYKGDVEIIESHNGAPKFMAYISQPSIFKFWREYIYDFSLNDEVF